MRLKTLSILILFIQPTVFAQITDIPKRTVSIELDGVINSSEWQNAFELNNFKQIEPNLGANATENVVVKVLYDAQFLYISANISFNDPSQIFATTLERDKAQSDDDYFEIYIDSYNDKLNTLVFRTNPLGARQDLEISRNGEDFNNSWNTFWTATSKINEDGWSTEMRIPFSSLRYEKSDINIMRIKAIVKYKLKNERVISPQNNTEIDFAHYHFSNSEEIQFQDLPSAKPLYITPYIKGNIISQNPLNTEGTAYENQTTAFERKAYANNETLDKVLSNIGLDIKYKPSANSTLDFTLNTDFAEVEVDDRIVNISRFPIFLPEKRLFFLENADLFNSNQFDHRLFNSRRIGIENGAAIPIIGGLRFTGNSSKWQYGVLNMQTHKVEDVALSNNMSVLRLRRTIGTRGSNIGLLNTNKINKEESNHLVAIDANIRFTDIIRTRITLASTFDTQTGNWKPMYGAALNTFRANGFGIDYVFRNYTENFNPELGFVFRPNTKRATLNNGWRRTYSNSDFLRFFRFGHYITKYWVSSTGAHETFQTNFYVTAIHKKGYEISAFLPLYLEDNLTFDWQIADGVTIPTGEYRMWKFNPFISTGNAKAYQLFLDVEFGDFYGGKQFTSFMNASYDFSKTFKAELGITYNNLSFPEAYAVNTSSKLNLSRYYTRLKLNFSSKASINTYIQYDTRSDKAGLNLRFRYNPIEGTDLYLVYNHNANTNRNALSPRQPFTDNQVIVVKFSKTFLN
ncbi:carbohydrate binding family 9 domain-containing protein [Maribacter halichondriae]|uniref:carbohydrate binding family 9 domain-containing protein n=1 Tax=Maribacter halichondriae TaxID=2980554 RepID=UPI002359113E|nr:DUF5916 domain-containing protein [Maribacter sp. Hal144]